MATGQNSADVKARCSIVSNLCFGSGDLIKLNNEFGLFSAKNLCFYFLAETTGTFGVKGLFWLSAGAR